MGIHVANTARHNDPQFNSSMAFSQNNSTWMTMTFPKALVFFSRFHHYQPLGLMICSELKRRINGCLTDIYELYIEYDIYCTTANPNHPCFMEENEWDKYLARAYAFACKHNLIIARYQSSFNKINTAKVTDLLGRTLLWDTIQHIAGKETFKFSSVTQSQFENHEMSLREASTNTHLNCHLSCEN